MAGTHPWARNRMSSMRPAAHSQSEFQNVAAGRVFDLGGGVRIGDFARVARILEVIEDLRLSTSPALNPGLEVHFDRINQRHQPGQQLLMHGMRTVGIAGRPGR